MAKQNTLNLTLKMNGVEVDNTLKSVKRKLYQLRGSVNKLEEGTEEWIEANRKLAFVDKEYRRMIKSQRDFRNEITGTIDSTKKQNKSIGSSIKSFIGLGAGAAGAFSIIQGGIQFIKSFTTEAATLARESKGIEFAFKALGEVGEDAFTRIKDSTRGLVSDLNIKQALVEFDNFNIGLEETDTLMEFLAVRSTQTGKSIDHLRDSLVEGLSKESKLRIDNLGISASELNAELEKTPDFVQAVANIAKREVKEAGNILDEAANSNAKWNAALENLKLNFGRLLENSGAGSFFKNIGASMLEAVTPAGDLAKEFEAQADRVIQLEKNLPPLVDEYESLREKSNLSNDEQSRLKDVIKEIAEIAPTAITAFDEYGNALDISAEKARDFIGTQKALLKFRNQEAIEQQTEALEDYTNQINILRRELNTRDEEGNIVRIVQKGGKIARIEQEKLSAETIARKQAELAKLQELEAGAQESISQLSGEYLDKYIERENAKTEKALEEARKRATAIGLEFDPEDTAAEINAMIKKYEAGYEDRLKVAQKNQESLAKLREEYRKLEEYRAADTAEKKIELERTRALKEAEQLRASKELIQDINDEYDAQQQELKEERIKENAEREAEIEEEIYQLKKEAELARELEKAETDAEKEELKLEHARELALRELSIQEELELSKVQAVENAESLKAQIREKYKLEEESINREFAKQEKNLREQQVEWTRMSESQKLAAVTESLSLAAEAFNQGSGAWKAVKISETLISTYQSAQNAFNALSSIPVVGPALGTTAAALAVAAGLKRVQAISSTPIKKVPKPRTRGFAKGGFTDGYGMGYTDGTGHEVAGVVHTGEYVVPQIVRRDPEVPQILDYLETKRKRKLGLYADGGDTVSNNKSSATPTRSDAELTKAIHLLVNRLNIPIQAETYYDYEAEEKRQKTQKKLDAFKKTTKFKG
ncbi:hypothetical protein MG296_10480 [Flavobacteriaceae bacterium TK19130]|nr:hypothetical protein [Thermobacterium salinum]